MEPAPDDNAVGKGLKPCRPRHVLVWACRLVHLAASVGFVVSVGLLLGLESIVVAFGLVLAIASFRYRLTFRSHHHFASALLVFLMFLFMAGLVFLFLPGVQASCGSSYEAQCCNNMREVACGLLQHQIKTGRLPAPILRDEEGRALHSWVVPLLPLLYEAELNSKIDRTNAWNAAVNQEAVAADIWWLRCPYSYYEDSRSGLSNYLPVVGPGSAWSDTKGESPQKILLVERATPVPWAEPRVLSADDLPPGESDLRKLASSKHVKTKLFTRHYLSGGHVAYGDGSVEFFQTGERIEVRVPQVARGVVALICLLAAHFLPIWPKKA